MIIDENFNVCEIGDIINKIKGLPSNSSSPSDTWIIYFMSDVRYKYDKEIIEKISSGFLKIFLDTDNLTYKLVQTLALNYELKIYKILQNVMKYKISPNFVRLLGTGEKCSYADLVKILRGNLYNSTDREIMSREEYTNNLNRNLYYILREKSKRPAIQDDVLLQLLRPVDFTNYRFNIIMTENMENNITLNKWLYTNRDRNTIELWNILFQIASACYVMSLSKIVHNDLHSGNIFVRDLGTETNFIYRINDIETVIKTRYQILIYDFDRAYTPILGDNPINESNCKKYSQCNILIPNKDIIKILCYVYKFVSSGLKENILEILSSNDVDKKRIENTYNLRSEKDGLQHCYLQYVDRIANMEKSIPNELYSNFYDNFQIIEKIREHLPNFNSELVGDENIYAYETNFFGENGEILIENIIEKKRKIERERRARVERVDEKEEEEFNLEDLEDVEFTLSDILKFEREGLLRSSPNSIRYKSQLENEGSYKSSSNNKLKSSENDYLEFEDRINKLLQESHRILGKYNNSNRGVDTGEIKIKNKKSKNKKSKISKENKKSLKTLKKNLKKSLKNKIRK